MASHDGLVVARTSFYSAGLRGMVKAGDIWDAADPVVKGYPAAFGPLAVHSSPSKPQRTPVSSRRPLPQRRATAAR